MAETLPGGVYLDKNGNAHDAWGNAIPNAEEAAKASQILSQTPPKPAPTPAAAPSRAKETVAPEFNITRQAYQLAQAHSLDLRAVEGTGRGGKITITDVRGALGVGVDTVI